MMSDATREELRTIDIAAPRLTRHYGGSLVLLGFSALLLLFALMALQESRDTAFLLCTIAVFMAIGPTVRLMRRSSMAFRCTLHEDGIRIARRGSEHDMRFAEMESIAVDEHPCDPIGIDRRITLRSAAVTERLRYVSGQERDAVTRHLIDGFARASRGKTLRGKGWSLDASRLQVGERSFEITSLAYAAVTSGEVCVWLRNDIHPSVRIPSKSANALVLIERLRQSLPRDATPPRNGLGIVLFERGRKKYVAVLAMIAAITFIALPVSIALLSDPIDTLSDVLIATATGGAALLLALWSVQLFTSRVIVHELGIRKKSAFGEAAIAFDEVERVRWDIASGGVGATTLSLVIATTAGKRERMTFTARPIDNDVGGLQARLAHVTLAFMLDRLEKTGEVTWGKFCFRRDAFEAGGRRYPYSRIDVAAVMGTVSIIDTLSGKKLGHVGFAHENFDAGVELLHRLTTSERDQSAPGSTSHFVPLK